MFVGGALVVVSLAHPTPAVEVPGVLVESWGHSPSVFRPFVSSRVISSLFCLVHQYSLSQSVQGCESSPIHWWLISAELHYPPPPTHNCVILHTEATFSVVALSVGPHMHTSEDPIT
jgi:hypothetical protein